MFLYFDHAGIKATCNMVDTQYKVCAGSYAREATDRYPDIKDRQVKLEKAGTLEKVADGLYQFVRPKWFRSSGEAGKIVSGQNCNGKKAWKDENGTELGEILSQR